LELRWAKPRSFPCRLRVVSDVRATRCRPCPRPLPAATSPSAPAARARPSLPSGPLLPEHPETSSTHQHLTQQSRGLARGGSGQTRVSARLQSPAAPWRLCCEGRRRASGMETCPGRRRMGDWAGGVLGKRMRVEGVCLVPVCDLAGFCRS